MRLARVLDHGQPVAGGNLEDRIHVRRLTVQMNRPDPFNQTDGMGSGTAHVNRTGYLDKQYNLWNRNPMLVAERYLESDGAEDAPPKTTLASY